AWARDEVADGISSLAAALADEDGEVVAAIHVHGPSYRFPAHGAEERLSDEVVATAARISASLRQAG
ncbi:MAG: Bacterial transcriptional regulator, partial [Chloroflexota bacterium]|nr:Bacterial transcriptional regulator [Chloroflexota bacterium]